MMDMDFLLAKNSIIHLLPNYLNTWKSNNIHKGSSYFWNAC